MRPIEAMLIILVVLIAAPISGQRLHVGYYENYPTGFSAEERVAGIMPELLNRIAEDNDWQLEYSLYDFAEGLDALANHEIDIYCGVAPSEERELLFKFNDEPVFSNWAELYTRRNTLKTIFDFKDKLVAVVENDIFFTGPSGLKRLSENFFLRIDFVVVPDYEAALRAVKDNMADAALVDHLLGVSEASKYGLSPAYIVLNPIHVKYAVSLVTVLTDNIIGVIDDELKKMKADPESAYYEIMDKYVSRLSVNHLWDWIIYAAVISAAILLLLWVNNILLKNKINKTTEQLRKNNEELTKASEKVTSLLKNTGNMISLIKEIGRAGVSEEEFMKDLLQIAIKLVPSAAAGSASLVEGENWRFVAAIGHDFEKLKKLSLKREYVFPANKVQIIDNIHSTNRLTMPYELYKKIVDATLMTETTIIAPLISGGETAGFLALDVPKKVDSIATGEWTRVMEAMAPLASAFLSNKLAAKTQYETQLSLVKSLVELIETRDPYTRGHSERVADYAGQLAKKFFDDDKRLNEIHLAGLLHDVGKVIVDEKLLNKSEPLTREELETVRKHSETGYRVLSVSKYLRPIADLVKHHHERWDGNGYPEGLKGDEIPLESRILSVADSLDAMLNKRPYRKSGMSIAQVIEELRRNSGSQFDPEVVEEFINMMSSRSFSLSGKPEQGLEVSKVL